MDPITRPEWGSHLPVLFALMSRVKESVLEIGTGIYSTPFLHWICLHNDVNLTSVENDDNYFDFANHFSGPNHEVVTALPDTEKAYDLVFVDSFPVEEREELVKSLSQRAKYIVVHDTLPSSYDGVFKYRFDYTKVAPHTSVFSNTEDVSNLPL